MLLLQVDTGQAIKTAGEHWYYPAMLTAIGAAAGYIAKLIIDWYFGRRKELRKLRVNLARIKYSLKEGWKNFNVQGKERDDLMTSLEQTQAELYKSYKRYGFAKVFEKTYLLMNEKERHQHAQMRAFTIYKMKPINADVLTRVKEVLDAKAGAWENKRWNELVWYLAKLELHLMTWEAKYQDQISEPSTSLIYVDDELKHGIPFPTGIEDQINSYLRG